MKEVRCLTKDELNDLIENAPDTETRNLKRIMKCYGIEPYDYFSSYAIDQQGIVIDGVPIYLGAITENNSGDGYDLWTVVRENVKEQFTLFKVAKNVSDRWAERFGKLYAIMEKCRPANIKWTLRLGFKKLCESDNYICFVKGG